MTTVDEVPSVKQPTLDLDGAWKGILDVYFPQFMTYCLPVIAAQFKWVVYYEPREQELPRSSGSSEKGKLSTDKFIPLCHKTGEKALAHVEIQWELTGWKKAAFPERMLSYRCRGREKYKKPIFSIAILIDDDPLWRPNSYQEEYLGSRLSIDYHVVKILDYQSRYQELENMRDPIAAVILAQLALLEYRGEPWARLQETCKIVKRLYQHKWSEDELLLQAKFVEWIVALPEAHMIEYRKFVKQVEEETNMPYMMYAERKGMEKGLEKGMEKGRQEGLHEGEANLLIRLLRHRFGEIPTQYMQYIQAADHVALLKWADKLLDAKTIDEVFA